MCGAMILWRNMETLVVSCDSEIVQMEFEITNSQWKNDNFENTHIYRKSRLEKVVFEAH